MNCPCGQPVNGASICATCHQALQVALGDISSHWRDLDTVKGRRTRYGGAGGGRGGEEPLPMDARFGGLHWVEGNNRLTGAQELRLEVPIGAVLVDATKNTIGTWGRAVMEDRPTLAGPTHDACLHVSCSVTRRSRPPRDDVPAVCRYLLGHADWIRTQHWAPEILDEIQDTAEQLRRMVDRPAERWYAGPCDEPECGRDLYAKAGARFVTCEACGISYHVEDRRADMLNRAYDLYATASEIARAISWLGHESVTAERIRKWVERKRLKRKGWLTVRGRELPTYRIGDVAALVEAASRTQKEAG